MVQDSSLESWLIFSHHPIANKISIIQVIEMYGDLRSFLKHLGSDALAPLEMAKSRIEAALRWSEKTDQHILTFEDPAYPYLLKEISHPPPLLYVQGNREFVSHLQVAVVGSRCPSPAGLENTRFFVKDLVRAGYCITSGLALGIDGASHRSALEAGGHTVAVLGSGLNSIYPKQHVRLAHAILEHGCLVSEFFLEAPPKKHHFPQRNRIISGLSLGVLVIEAKRQSGSLATARYAAEQGREVFAVPGSIRHALSYGCHQLLRDGAMLVESSRDIIEALNHLHLPVELVFSDQCANERDLARELDLEQQQLLACIDYQGTFIDDIVNRSQLSYSTIVGLLLSLELGGYIRSKQQEYIRVK